MKYALLLSLVLVFLCIYAKRKNIEKLYIPADEKLDYQLPFYGHHNFIVDSTKIYHYVENPFAICTFAVDNKRPDFIELLPVDLTIIDPKNLERFLLDNVKINAQSLKPSIVNVAVISKVIPNSLHVIFSRFFASHKSDALWQIRPITEEEKLVWLAKKSNSEYNPHRVKWSANFSHGKIPYADSNYISRRIIKYELY